MDEIENTTTPVATVNLEVAVLATLLQAIDFASTKGAFMPNQMKVIGSVYDIGTTLLKAVADKAGK